MSGDQEAFQKAMNQGHSAAWDQSWNQAAGFYRVALDEFPDHPAALTSLALALYEMQDFETAARYYLRAAQASPNDPVPFEKLANIYERQNRVNEAVRTSIQAADLYLKARDIEKSILNWRRVLSLQESLLARTRLAMIFERTGRKPEAVNEYLACASLMQHSGDLAKAMQVAEYALQLMPDHSEAQRSLTMLRTNQPLSNPVRPRSIGTGPISKPITGQLEAPRNVKQLDPISEAKAESISQLAGLLFDRAEEKDILSSTSRRGLSALTRGTGGLSAANAERTRILLHLGQAIDSQSQGQDAQAAEELERALDIGLKHPAAFYLLGCLNHPKDPQKALRFLQQSVKHPDFALASFLLIGKTKLSENNLPEASAAYLQALRLADASSVPTEQADELRQLYEPLIDDHSSQKDANKQRKLCETITLQLIRPDWRAYLSAARQQLPAQEPGSPPLPLAEMILESQSSQVVERLALVRSLAAQNKITAAMEEAYNALQYAPTYLPLHIQIGDLLVKEGRIQDGVIKFMLVADLYSLRGDSNQAIHLLNRVVQFAPMNITVRNRLIDLLVAQGKSAEAVQQYLLLADLYTRLSELDAARQAYVNALKVAQQARLDHSIWVNILLHIADIDSQHLEFRSAIINLEQVRSLDPENGFVRTQLVDLNFRTGQDLVAVTEASRYVNLLEKNGASEKAIEFIEEAINNRPDKLELRRILAEAYQRHGQVDLAAEQLEAQAQGLLASGKRQEAIAALESILSMNPINPEKYRKMMQKLQGNPVR